MPIYADMMRVERPIEERAVESWQILSTDYLASTEWVNLANLLLPSSELWLYTATIRPDTSAGESGLAVFAVDSKGIYMGSIWQYSTNIISGTTAGVKNLPPALGIKLRLYPAYSAVALGVFGGQAWYVLLLDNPSYENKALKFGTNVIGGPNCIRGQIAGPYAYDSYSSAAGSETEVSRIDLGKDFDLRKLALRLHGYISAAATGSFIKVYTSEDGVTYTQIWSSGDLPTSETEWYPIVENIKARYIRITVNSAVTTSTVYVKVYPIFAWGRKGQ